MAHQTQSDPTELPVMCILKKPWRGVLYETRIPFEPGETKMLPAQLARKYISHHDVFSAGEVNDAPKKSKAEIDSELIKLQMEKVEKDEAEKNRVMDFKQDIDLKYDKDALKELATRYGHKFKGNVSVERMRTEVKDLVDRFGIV